MEKEKLQKLIDGGLNNVEIGVILGCNRDTVGRRLKKYEIERKKYEAHPNLNKEFFEKIDTKEKAYWLGFLFADGYICKKRRGFVLDIAKKDERVIYDFCMSLGANKDKIKERVHKCGSKSIKISIYSSKMVKDLENYGCVNNKSFIIRLPEFNNQEINLAFLSGYYDGDGSANSSKLCCGCKKFLEDIKKKYNIKFNIKNKISVYTLWLGSDFRRKMIKNYPNCMDRKKSLHAGDQRNKLNGINPNTTPRNYVYKFKITKEHLEYLISKYPYTKIGEMYEVSGNAIKKRAIKMGIELNDQRGYWTKKKYNKK